MRGELKPVICYSFICIGWDGEKHRSKVWVKLEDGNVIARKKNRDIPMSVQEEKGNE